MGIILEYSYRIIREVKMFTVEDLEKRVESLKGQVDQAASNYNVLVGAKMSMEGMLAEAKNAACKDAKVEAALDAVGEV